jgi:hypothetical protein
VNKYRNVPTELDGIIFHSKREAGRYAELKMLLRSNIISDLVLQKEYELRVNGVLICKYRADFVYKAQDGREIVEDSKGVRTRDYALKAKLMLAVHGLRVIEV